MSRSRRRRGSRRKDMGWSAESFLSTWLGLPSIALGIIVVMLIAMANYKGPVANGRLIEQETGVRANYNADGVFIKNTSTKFYVLSPDGWLCVAVGAILGFVGAAERRGKSILSVSGLCLNLLAFLVCWLVSMGLLV